MLLAEQKLQEAAEGLQNMMGDVRTASEPLIGRLEAVAANLVKLELQHLSWDVLLLGQATLRKKERLKVIKSVRVAFFLKAKTTVADQSDAKQRRSKRIIRNANSYVSRNQEDRKFCLQEPLCFRCFGNRMVPVFFCCVFCS